MRRTYVAIVDATRARLFTYQREAVADGVREDFVEVSDLVNPARHQRPSELFSDTRPGSSRTGNLQYTFDDHRAAHIAEIDAAFARSIVADLARLLKATPADRLILCASPNMLSELREALEPLRLDRSIVDERAVDLTKLTEAQIRDHLAAYELLPARPPRPMVRGA